MFKNGLNFETAKHAYYHSVKMLESYLSAYALQPSDLSAERKKQLENVLIEAAKSAGGTAIVKVTEILREEAAKKGLPQGTAGTSENTEAKQKAEALAKAEADAAAKKKRTQYLIGGGIALVVVGLITAIAIKKRKR